MANNKKQTKENKEKEPATFEVAMERLEKIVEEMENAELPLEDILQRYEEGTHLKKFCEEKLKEAEKRVQQIQPDTQDNPVVTETITEKTTLIESLSVEEEKDEDLLL
ncbi:MAG: exodeoxyribonuclease VII small subunit [Verrucomicrobiae bacterium]|nr:exodeoxyribonuclease VII small subunit [Verrucomicrobiae bacterium]